MLGGTGHWLPGVGQGGFQRSQVWPARPSGNVSPEFPV